MRPEGWETVRRILVIRLDNIGDVVMLSPALRALHNALPEATITLMASPAGSQIAGLLPWVDDVIVERVVWQDISGSTAPDPEREVALVNRIRTGRFDAALIFTSFSQSPYPPAYVCYLAGIPIRLGQSKEFGGSLLTQWVKSLPDETHQVDRNLWLLESAGFDLAGRQLELHVPAGVQAAADAALRQAGLDPFQPFIVVAPGASAAARRYDPQGYAQVVRLLAQQALPVAVAGSQRELGLIEPILEASRGLRVVSLAGRTTVPELVGVVRRSSLVVANNSGPLHFADAFRRPMVILYSGTDYESQWRPRSAPAILLRRPTGCSPCYAFRCPYGMECLDIPPEEVVRATLALLEGVSNGEALSMRIVPSSLSPGREDSRYPG